MAASSTARRADGQVGVGRLTGIARTEHAVTGQGHHVAQRGAAPLDRYSSPSGHTLHAVCFTAVVISSYPGLAWVLAPFTLVVAASRVVLGLHYPTDVAAGAVLGALLATGVTRFWPI